MLDKEGKNIDAVHRRHARSHARDGRAGVHAARQARLRREAADAHAVGSPPAHRTPRRSTRSRRRWATRATRTTRTRVAAEIIWSGEIGDVTEVHAFTRTGPAGRRACRRFPPPERRAGHARLGSVARAGRDASVHGGRRRVPQDTAAVRLLPAVQLARLLRLRQRPDRRLGRPPPRPGQPGAAARQPDRASSALKQGEGTSPYHVPARRRRHQVGVRGAREACRRSPVCTGRTTGDPYTPRGHDDRRDAGDLRAPAREIEGRGAGDRAPARGGGRRSRRRRRPAGERRCETRAAPDVAGPRRPGGPARRAAATTRCSSARRAIWRRADRGEGVGLLPARAGRSTRCRRGS